MITEITPISLFFNVLDHIVGTNNKKNYIQQYATEDIKYVMQWLYDTSIVTDISDSKYDKEVEEVQPYKTLKELFLYLSKRHTGSDYDISVVKSTAKQLCKCETDFKFFKSLLTKNVKVGIDSKLINSVFPNLIPTFDVMLADKYLDLDDKQLNKVSNNGTREFVLQEKLDGFRCIAIKEGESVRLISRQGKLYENLVDVESAIIKTFKGYDCVLDGELLISNRENIPSKEQYKATSKLVTLKDVEIKGITYNVFDLLPITDWQNKVGNKPYDDRYSTLCSYMAKNTSNAIKIVPCLYRGNNLDEVLTRLKIAKEMNWEGLMLRWVDSLYEFKRSKELLKVKPFNEMDLIITGYEEGTNKNKGKLGAFICEVEHPKFGHIEAKVGGGYSDEERERFAEIRNDLIGRTIEVQYFEVTENTTTHIKSLRFPVYKCIKDIGVVPNN